MKKMILSVLSMVVVAGMSGICSGLKFENGFTLTPYVGLDAQFRHMKFVEGAGGNEFKKNYYPQASGFLGIKFNQYFGVEAGYLNSKTEKSSSVASKGSIFTVALDPDVTVFSNNEAKLNAFHINLVGFWPLDERSQLIGAVGISRAKIRLVHQPIADQIGDLPVEERVSQRRGFIAKKTIAQIKAGFQHDFSDMFGIRCLIGWDNTARFKNISSTTASSPIRVSLKNSYTLSLGIIFRF